MTMLILKHSQGCRENDYDVLDAGKIIGRIMLHPQVPEGRRPWFWTITDRYYPRTIHSRGYCATREQAMADFKAQWSNTPR